MSVAESYLADEAATVEAGRMFGQALAGRGAVVYLQGELGAGKTTFTRGVLQSFGYRGAVKSPTYTLVEPYEFEGGRQVFHFDLYRLGDPEELEYMGIRDYFGADSLCLIEWPARGEGFLPTADLTVSLILKKNIAQAPGRALTVQALSEHGKTIAKQLSMFEASRQA